MIRNDIKSLTAYLVPDASGMIKLDAMENPFSLPDELKQAWAASLANIPINRYPDAGMPALRQAIAKREGVQADQILLGNGSDEIIQMLLIASEPGTCIVPAPTFVMYQLICRWFKRQIANVELQQDFSLDADAFLQVCAREKASIAFLACPNNPTGNLWPAETVQRIAKNMHGLLIIDEAYAPFSPRTHTQLISPNVAILRTFSKMGWAGLRLGYLLGEADFIAHLNKVRMPYNINALTQQSAMFFLNHASAFEQQAEKVCQERAAMFKALAQLEGIESFPSQANFILIRVADANRVFNSMREKGVLIKNMHDSQPLLNQCLRITIGTPEENKVCIQVLKESLA